MKLGNDIAAVVTGGASGLGRASAEALAGEGVKVAIFDVNEEGGKQNAVQGGFSWSDDGRRYVLDLTNPLGSTEARVEGRPGAASLTKADGTRLVADNPDALAEDALGSSMPVSGLRDWLRGKLAADPQASDVKRDELGRPIAFEQGGWRANLSRYDEKGPQLLVLERLEPGRRILVRLVVNQS